MGRWGSLALNATSLVCALQLANVFELSLTSCNGNEFHIQWAHTKTHNEINSQQWVSPALGIKMNLK